jgi:ABC-type multidrug transport system fused ATPase/permease subunit
LVVVFCVKGLVAFMIHRRILRFAFDFRARLIERLMETYLSMPFSFYLLRGSNSMVQSVTHHTKILTDEMLIPSLRFASDLFVLVLVSAFLLWVSPWAMATLALVFGLAFAAYLTLMRPRVRAAGKVVSEAHQNMSSGVSHGINGIKEIRVLGAERTYLEDVTRAATRNKGAETAYNSMLIVPRYLMETVVVIFILGLTLQAISSGRDTAEMISVVAMFAAAGLRALPAMTQVSASIAMMNYSVHALHAVDSDLRLTDGLPQSTGAVLTDRASAVEQPMMRQPHFSRITTEQLSFTYEGAAHTAVDGVDLQIVEGTTVGFIGESGSGKTTLIDLLVGLLRPSQGRIAIDGVDIGCYGVAHWMRRIAYIPQSPFIAEDTLARNVALGVGEGSIDEARLSRCIEMARLSDVVDRLPTGLQTVLGGHGSRLSGGERQRVALARALYQDRDVLVFDEATSALDSKTEREIVATIDGLRGSKTIIVIAHRLSTVQGCDIVHRMSRGRITGSGTLDQLMSARAAVS